VCIALLGGEGAIYHHDIPVKNALPAHRMARDGHKKGGGGMANQVAIQVNALLDVVLSRGREAGTHTGGKQGKLEHRSGCFREGQGHGTTHRDTSRHDG
jgi:hypothetical protein